jgi:hypothetical protein
VRSLFGLRPGFGFAGITHSLEAKQNIKKAKKERREGGRTYLLPIASKKKK